jgi:hypothetical protein
MHRRSAVRLVNLRHEWGHSGFPTRDGSLFPLISSPTPVQLRLEPGDPLWVIAIRELSQEVRDRPSPAGRRSACDPGFVADVI